MDGACARKIDDPAYSGFFLNFDRIKEMENYIQMVGTTIVIQRHFM